MELDEIIQFENESTYIDFKATEYVKGTYVDFLKDVIAMANCDHNGSKYIVVGVKLKSDGTRSYLGLEKLTDSAIFQKLVSDKIEPELSIEYTPYDFKNVRLGVFTIPPVTDQPYIIKNQYKDLMPGDSFIRVGTHQRRINRKDLDRIYESKYDTDSFQGDLKFTFTDSGTDNLELEGLRELEFPSDNARKRILEAITKKEEEEKKKSQSSQINPLLNLPKIRSFYSSVPYEERTLEELKENLENVKKVYEDDDYHYYFETKAQLLNFTILNDSDKYLEDCTVELRIDETPFLRIADRVYEEPEDSGPFNLKSLQSMSHIPMNYPRVEVSGKKYVVVEHLRDLAHKIPCDLFTEPLRVVPIGGLEQIIITIDATIFGKNLKVPLERKLHIVIN
ncbi:MAG: ATP-binding protein [Cyclobacteriaceae bacterium]